MAKAIKGIRCTVERERMALLIGRVCAERDGYFNWSSWNNACGL